MQWNGRRREADKGKGGKEREAGRMRKREGGRRRERDI